MAANYRKAGNVTEYTPVADVTAGQLIKVSTFGVVAENPIPAGKQGGVRTTGVYDIPMSTALITNVATAGGRPIGHPVDIDIANQNLVVDGSGDSSILLFLAEALPVGKGIARVYLNQFGQ